MAKNAKHEILKYYKMGTINLCLVDVYRGSAHNCVPVNRLEKKNKFTLHILFILSQSETE